MQPIRETVQGGGGLAKTTVGTSPTQTLKDFDVPTLIVFQVQKGCLPNFSGQDKQRAMDAMMQIRALMTNVELTMTHESPPAGKKAPSTAYYRCLASEHARREYSCEARRWHTC